MVIYPVDTTKIFRDTFFTYVWRNIKFGKADSWERVLSVYTTYTSIRLSNRDIYLSCGLKSYESHKNIPFFGPRYTRLYGCIVRVYYYVIYYTRYTYTWVHTQRCIRHIQRRYSPYVRIQKYSRFYSTTTNVVSIYSHHVRSIY